MKFEQKLRQKDLVLLRGLPGSGKSTWIKDNGFEPYTLSPDTFRMLIGGLELNVEGNFVINQDTSADAFKMMHELLEKRMQRGEFVIIDATNLSNGNYEFYNQLSQKHEYKIHVVDFTDVEFTTLLERDTLREEHKKVGVECLQRMMKSSIQQTEEGLPSYTTVWKPNEFTKESISPQMLIIDETKYKKVNHIGDIHGCRTVLGELTDWRLQDDEFYIFTGDFFERGTENAEVARFILAVYTKPNVICIEGNHELYAYQWANNETITCREFREVTALEFEEAGIKKDKVRRFYRHLLPHLVYQFGKHRVVVTHGGISTFPKNLGLLPRATAIRGVGDYSVDIEDLFNANTETLNENSEYTYWQVHGHRNTMFNPIVKGRSVNLEGGVEQGGHIRMFTLTPTSYESKEVLNTVYNEKFKPTKITPTTKVEDVVEMLRNNPYVKESVLENNISAFNFNSQAFYNGIWDNQTVTARGLFINTKTNTIVSRSYNKFFDIVDYAFELGENRNVYKGELRHKLKFPLGIYEKLNGYLGIIGFDEATNELVISSKSTTLGDYADEFKRILFNTLDTSALLKLKMHLKKFKRTATFEVISPEFDPHIIEYKEPKVVLLGLVENSFIFKRVSWDETVELATELGLEVAKKVATLNTWEEFLEFYKETQQENPLDLRAFNVEGYIVVSNDDFMAKIKMPYYLYWKMIRGKLYQLLQGKSMKAVCNGLDDTTRSIVELAYELSADKPTEDVNIISILKEKKMRYKVLEILLSK